MARVTVRPTPPPSRVNPGPPLEPPLRGYLSFMTAPILLIDNFDSFTYNIVHLLRSLGVPPGDIEVVRNTRLQLRQLSTYQAVISSPGPGLPETSGALLPAVEACIAQDVPYFGICLGLQALGMVCGGRLRRLAQVQHGVQHRCRRDAAHRLLDGLPDEFDVGRYHSWVIDEAGAPEALETLASTDGGVIQAAAHRTARAYGVQFHPESIMSPEAGPTIVGNFLRIAGVGARPAYATETAA